MLHGYRAYSGVTLQATQSGTASTGKPDITIAMDAANRASPPRPFAANACSEIEGTITAGTHRLLRLQHPDAQHRLCRSGAGQSGLEQRLRVGGCHGHYHFRSFAQYRLLDSGGAVVRTGKKVGFCLMDITRIDSGASPSARYLQQPGHPGRLGGCLQLQPVGPVDRHHRQRAGGQLCAPRSSWTR